MAQDKNGEDKPKMDPQKQYLIEQFGNLMEKVGEGYGGPLQEELIRRLEQTVADYDEEVNEANYKTTSVYGFGHPYFYNNVVEVLRGNIEPETDGREGLKSLEVLVAAYLSARNGQTISLPLEL